ncbi:M28 family peptidase [Campylobacter sp.]|uniref:M28 family peptidase n=1 Tax=Campylobacter sp. TaxID=205 RepID=UPI0026DBF512|nr:M28 family peptidase [Campylobacter sp.]MDO4674013.1 M20/M25/M40 family metallo-hydrolase [Campylobacter sp.]
MQSVMENFKKISQIPHCSFQTEALREFLSAYAKEKGFECSIDRVGNIHCLKGRPQICLQSHYDMVCMGDAPRLELYEEAGFLKAKNSSLGADNGIGVAIMMAAMAEFEHLECLFTNDEEVGLLGAKGLEHQIRAPKLLNLDHEGEGEIMISCAGGVDMRARLPLSYEEESGRIYRLEARNFRGGHSGIDIVKNHKNALKEMARFIAQNDGKIIAFQGGERINSIPKHAAALILTQKKPCENAHIACEFVGEERARVCSEGGKILSGINAFSHGVRAFDQRLGIVQSSVNLSLLKMSENEASVELFARSNVLEDLQNLEFETLQLFKALGFSTESFNFYPPWQGEENAFSAEVFEALAKFTPEPKISAIHAGLECGIIEAGQKVLCCSIGPNIHSPHSTYERVELSSVEKISGAVFEILKKNQ